MSKLYQVASTMRLSRRTHCGAGDVVLVDLGKPARSFPVAQHAVTHDLSNVLSFSPFHSSFYTHRQKAICLRLCIYTFLPLSRSTCPSRGEPDRDRTGYPSRPSNSIRLHGLVHDIPPTVASARPGSASTHLLASALIDLDVDRLHQAKLAELFLYEGRPGTRVNMVSQPRLVDSRLETRDSPCIRGRSIYPS